MSKSPANQRHLLQTIQKISKLKIIKLRSHRRRTKTLPQLLMKRKRKLLSAFLQHQRLRRSQRMTHLKITSKSLGLKPVNRLNHQRRRKNSPLKKQRRKDQNCSKTRAPLQKRVLPNNPGLSSSKHRPQRPSSPKYPRQTP